MFVQCEADRFMENGFIIYAQKRCVHHLDNNMQNHILGPVTQTFNIKQQQ